MLWAGFSLRLLTAALIPDRLPLLVSKVLGNACSCARRPATLRALSARCAHYRRGRRGGAREAGAAGRPGQVRAASPAASAHLSRVYNRFQTMALVKPPPRKDAPMSAFDSASSAPLSAPFGGSPMQKDGPFY